MFYRNYNNQDLFKPSLLVFHGPGGHEHFPGSPGHGRPKSKPQQRAESGVPITPESKEHREEKEVLKRPYANTRVFTQNPEKIASKEHLNDFFSGRTDEIGQIWRLMSPPRKMQYFLIQEPNGDIKRSKFVRMHQSEVWANYRRDMEIYAEKPAINKVPLIALPTKSMREVPTGDPIIFLGGSLAANMANHEACKDAKTNYLSGSNDPAKALAALQNHIEGAGKSLEGGKVVVSFGPEMFAPGMDLGKMTHATEKLCKLAKENGMKVVMATPLSTYVPVYNEAYHARKGVVSADKRETQKLRKKYMNFTAELYQQGLISSMVDVATGVEKQTRGNQRYFSLNYYKDSNDISKGLNEEGTRLALAGIIDGVYAVDGDTGHGKEWNGDFSGKTHLARTNAGRELYYFGSGVNYDPETKKIVDAPVEGQPKTVELIPGYESRASVAKLPKMARMALHRLTWLETGVTFGLHNLTEKQLKKEVDRNESYIDELTDPKEKEFAKLQFMRQKASIYYMYAWRANWNGKYDKALAAIEDARQNNKDFLRTQIPPIFRIRLKRLERAIGKRVKVSGPRGNVYGGPSHAEFLKAEAKKTRATGPTTKDLNANAPNQS